MVFFIAAPFSFSAAQKAADPLSPAGIFHRPFCERRLEHGAVEIHRCHGAVFEAVTRARLGAFFEQPAPQAPEADHASPMFFQVRSFMSLKKPTNW
jgi:hypothetical protein